MTDEHVQRATVYGALLRVQQKVHSVSKDAKNPHFRNSYASLDTILETVRPVLIEEGLVLTQSPGWSGNHVLLETMFTHAKTGYRTAFYHGSPVSKLDPQGLGSAVTYLRRYSLLSILALATPDDDGEAARQPERREVAPGRTEAGPGIPDPFRRGKDAEQAVRRTQREQNTRAKSQKADREQPDTPEERLWGIGKYAKVRVKDLETDYLNWVVSNMDKPEKVEEAQGELDRRAMDQEGEATPSLDEEPNFGGDEDDLPF